jgi:hypothetical protein
MLPVRLLPSALNGLWAAGNLGVEEHPTKNKMQAVAEMVSFKEGGWGNDIKVSTVFV